MKRQLLRPQDWVWSGVTIGNPWTAEVRHTYYHQVFYGRRFEWHLTEYK